MPRRVLTPIHDFELVAANAKQWKWLWINEIMKN
jgi:hypothetical protein